jgi:hypothetical protein
MTPLSDFYQYRHLSGDAPGEAWARWGKLFDLRSSPRCPITTESRPFQYEG